MLWYLAMVVELKYIDDLGSFNMIQRPRGANIPQSIWDFKCKRSPGGRLRKYKASYCVRGGQYVDGVDIFDTYAHVVSWITVRRLLMVLNLHTQHVGYTNALYQAPLDQTVYVELPRGFEVPNMLLHSKQSSYGLR